MPHDECWARLFQVVEPEMLRAYIVYAFVVTFTAEGAEHYASTGRTSVPACHNKIPYSGEYGKIIMSTGDG